MTKTRTQLHLHAQLLKQNCKTLHCTSQISKSQQFANACVFVTNEQKFRTAHATTPPQMQWKMHVQQLHEQMQMNMHPHRMSNTQMDEKSHFKLTCVLTNQIRLHMHLQQRFEKCMEIRARTIIHVHAHLQHRFKKCMETRAGTRNALTHAITCITNDNAEPKMQLFTKLNIAFALRSKTQSN